MLPPSSSTFTHSHTRTYAANIIFVTQVDLIFLVEIVWDSLLHVFNKVHYFESIKCVNIRVRASTEQNRIRYRAAVSQCSLISCVCENILLFFCTNDISHFQSIENANSNQSPQLVKQQRLSINRFVGTVLRSELNWYTEYLPVDEDIKSNAEIELFHCNHLPQ